MIWGISVWVLLAFISRSISSAFADDDVVKDLIKHYLWILPFGFSFHRISQLISASCNGHHPPFSLNCNKYNETFFLILIPLIYLSSNF